MSGNINLRTTFGSTGVIEICYLVEQSANVCNPTFVVYIPSIMGGIEASEEGKEESTDLGKRSLNKNGLPGKISLDSCIVAKNWTTYGHRLDGWIPHFKAARAHMATGKWTSGKATLSGPTTEEAGPKMHAHETTGIHTINNLTCEDITFDTIDIWSSTEVDFQNINNKVIKYGHKMIGCFPLGEQSSFIILGIDDVTPRFKSADNRANADRTDEQLDGEKNPENSKMT